MEIGRGSPPGAPPWSDKLTSCTCLRPAYPLALGVACPPALLAKGQAIVAGAAVNTPVLCRVRQRVTEHGAEDVDAPARWREWFIGDRAGQRERDLALPVEPETRGRSKLFKT